MKGEEKEEKEEKNEKKNDGENVPRYSGVPQKVSVVAFGELSPCLHSPKSVTQI